MNTGAENSARNLGRSTAAIFAGFFAVVALSLGTDQALHILDVYPPWGQPMPDLGDNLLALSYRCVYAVAGSYIAASLAPRNPMHHALILGGVGTALSLVGAIATIPMNLGPAWYPISLVVTALPCAWLAGVLYEARKQKWSAAQGAARGEPARRNPQVPFDVKENT